MVRRGRITKHPESLIKLQKQHDYNLRCSICSKVFHPEYKYQESSMIGYRCVKCLKKGLRKRKELEP